MKLSVFSEFMMIILTLGNDISQWLCIQSKENRALDRTSRNPVTKLLCEETQPSTLTDCNLSDKYDENYPKALPDMPNMPCKRSRGMP